MNFPPHSYTKSFSQDSLPVFWGQGWTKKCVSISPLPDEIYQDPLLAAPATPDFKQVFWICLQTASVAEMWFLFLWKSTETLPIHKKVIITLLCFPQTKANAPACSFPPVTGTGQTFLGHGTNRCLGAPMSGHPEGTIPHPAMAAGSYPQRYFTGQQEIP